MKYLFIILLSFFLVQIKAAHVIGGEMIYEYLGPGGTTNTKSYRVTLKLFKEANVGAALPPSLTIGIFSGGTLFGSYQVVNLSNGSLGSNLSVNPFPACMTNPPSLNYVVGLYPFTVELPNNAAGYDISYQTCCRTNNMENVNSPAGNGGAGSTYTCFIPGSNLLASTQNNSSPQFRTNVSVICYDSPFTFDFGASDPDGDSLVYSFCNAYDGGGAQNSGYATPAAPPFGSLTYINGYGPASPMGGNITINPQTGLISGVAPSVFFGNNRFIVSVCINAYRNGQFIGMHQKDFQIQINNCSLPEAVLDFNTVTCDGFTHSFLNSYTGTSAINNYYWDFGVSGVLNDTSNIANPSFTFPDTGVYKITLIVNRGGSCTDTATRPFGIYPGFFPAFNSTGVCFNTPIQFNDASTTNYGVVDSWRWDFGDAAVLSDTSRIRNPQYQYPSSGPKNVQLIVTNSKGCIDTVEKPIVLIDKPTITLPFKDTLICSIDTLQLRSTFSSGNATWSPNYRIINPNTNNPFVYPLVTTTYIVTSNDQGCIQTDTVRVNVKDFVTVDVMPDTAICLTDRIILRTNSDALSYIWTPAATLSNATAKNPIATPIANITKYYVSANIGKCQSSDSVTITASPYPLVTVNNDTTICFGGQARLIGTATGTSYNWSPLNGLINFNTLTPIASPARTTTYILSTQGAPGCPKPAFDTIVVTVIPPIQAFAGNDTTIVRGQPLQLNATGSTNYLWTPRNFLNIDTISNPIATLINNQNYVVKVSNATGCFATDTIKITVFQTEPDIFVPTAFSPNADGRNDKLIPVPVGLKSYDYFEVYNRWGNRMYYTTQLKQGWDGTYKGLPQITDTYVWQVRGTDYTGKVVYKKGTVVLLR
jgi:gliding motility-associated-like protein